MSFETISKSMSAEILVIAFLTLIAGVIGTVTGFGISTILVSALLFFLPLGQTLLLVGIIHLFGDLWKVLLFRGGVRWGLILGFGIPGVIASFVGARLVFAVPEVILSQLLGGFLIAYVIFLFAHPRFKLKPNHVTAVLGGTSSGFLAGIFGVGGATRSAFLTAFDLHKVVYIAVSGAIAFLVDAARVATYAAGGISLGAPLWWGLLLFIPVSFLGALIARPIVERIPQERFRAVVAAFLFLVGVKLLFFP